MKKLILIITFYFTLSINVYSTEIKNNDLQSFINEWWQVPYKWGGTTHKGIDCSAFIQRLYKSVFEIELPRTCREQYKKCIKIAKDSLSTGDLVFFKMAKNKWHVGIYLTNGQFAHASVSKGVWISDLKQKYWEKYFYKACRIC